MNSIKTKAVIYCRVSSKEQEIGYSLDSQQKLLEEYAGKNNFKIEKIYRISESASGRQIRKTFNEMLQYVTKNKIPIILCEKIDRLTRNPKDAGTVDEWVREDEKRAVHFVKESFVVNGQTKAHENLVWNMKVAIAKFYSENLSEEVKKGQKEKISQGWFPTKPPLGYKSIGEEGHRTHIIDEAIAPLIRQMFEWYATGNYSLSRLQKELYEAGLRSRTWEKEVDGKKIQKGGKRVPISKIHTMLQDPFYYGKMRWKGEVFPAEHASIIDKPLFDKVQVLLRRKTKNPHYSKHNPLFKSKIVCEHCGGLVTWYFKKGHWYGHCNNHGEYRKCPKKTCIRQDRIEEQYMGVFDIIAPHSDEVLLEIENVLKDEHADKVAEREKEVSRINGLLTSARQQKDKYYEAKINREAPLEYCERRIAESTQEEESLEAALVAAGDKNDEYLQLGLVVHELAYKSKEIYEKANVDEKRLLLSQLFTNIIQDELKIKPKYTKAADFLTTWIPKLNYDYELAKNSNLNVKDAVLATSSSKSSNWLGDMDSNHDSRLQRPESYR